MTLEVTQGYQNCLYSIDHISIPINVCSNNDSILPRFRDIITFTVNVTGCDLEKSSVFEKTVEITSHVRLAGVTLTFPAVKNPPLEVMNAVFPDVR